MREVEAFIMARQAASPCGFIVTAVKDCPAGCTATPIAGLFGDVAGSLTCRDVRSLTASANASPRTASATPANGATTVTSTNRVTVTGTTASTQPTALARPSSSRVLSAAPDLISTEAPSSSALTTATTPTSTSSTSLIPSPANFVSKGSKEFAQTTGGILTITFLTLGLLAATILAIVFWRKRQQRRSRRDVKASEEGAAMTEIASTISYGPYTDPSNDIDKRTSGDPNAAVVEPRKDHTVKSAFDEAILSPAANDQPQPAPRPNRFRFSTATSNAADVDSRRASSMYSEDQADLHTSDGRSFGQQHEIPSAANHRPPVHYEQTMANLRQEHEARGGYGIPEIPPEVPRRPRTDLTEFIARDLERNASRTDRWDPDAPRGSPPIPERSVARMRPGDGTISRKPVG